MYKSKDTINVYLYPAACNSNNSEYLPFAFISSSCDPTSATIPSAITAIRSAIRTVENLCEITIPILPFRFSFNSAKIAASASGSKEDVGSSKIQMSASRYMIRASARRCHSPPERS